MQDLNDVIQFREDCDEWIRLATSTLVRLHCLTESTNLYSPMPVLDSFLSQTVARDGSEEDNFGDEVCIFKEVSPLQRGK